MKSYTPDIIHSKLDLRFLEATWGKNKYFSDHNINSKLPRNITIITFTDLRQKFLT